jgi:hypothetical protein
MDALAASVDPAARRRARFMPVFPERVLDWRTEWAELAGRHAGLVLPPILQDADGTLRLDDLGWAEGPQAVSGADARRRAIPGSSHR